MSITRKFILVIMAISLMVALINILMITHYEQVVSDQRDFYNSVVSSVIDHYERRLNETIEYYEDALNRHKLWLNGSAHLNLSIGSVHATVRFFKNGELFFEQYCSGSFTNLGVNRTLGKLCGDSWYNMTAYNLNATFISIGNQGTLSASSTVLPAEWNRTAGSVEDQAYNSYNLTCTFYPDAGPYTADCIGVNLENLDGANDLIAYDTFTEVTGIDDTFTITVEFKLSGS